MLRVLIVDESRRRAATLKEALVAAGYEVVAAGASPLALLKQVERTRPDVIVIDTDSPSRDVIEHLCVVTQHEPRPIVMFASDSSPATIREAVRAGVAAYVVDGLDAARVQPIVEVARARFDEYQRLRTELADANRKLSERKVVERAKGLLMQRRGCSEHDAYAELRRLAMDRGKRLGEIAQSVVDAAELLG